MLNRYDAIDKSVDFFDKYLRLKQGKNTNPSIA